ncbi:IclR family transcriptional regulator [Bradyrhizobium sp. NP1]|uniref:IclR family transcriptional regulator n=1 Tax=Bradyrhizobium sp. NP1 TaxID=3049772 RepID=UPI0025A61379|nr:IclR family transcriptional regulator [Bradyrhizobium sp. NP1]WJR75856.1 IclR family transcriptional regulator [Bradyrhizobium sp. NP1]
MLTKPDDDQDTKITAIQKAVRLLQAIVSADQPPALADLSEQVALPKPTVHRLLLQLEEVGFVQRDLSGRAYTVGATWLRLSVDALAVRARQPIVHGIMQRLVDTVRESCNLAVLQNQEVLYLERVECDWPLRVQLHAGSRVPIHATASGKLLIAQMSEKNRKALLRSVRREKFTDNTIVDLDQMEEECRIIRENDLSINKEEYHRGLIGVAVPVRRADNSVIATLSIHAPSFRMSVETALSYVPLLKKSAAEIVAELGL